ncbi:hypothetical protein MAR_033366 [Mya arenaria]|uniref:Myb/SANT-like DNA-binding domain-containing protein n=1 Tax=Mya arenaria TaxID=6604 RepID=A0ABY7GB65_MYAAR|nr:hypothetical protein MAR_033366 [Mya arenaria]
MLDSGGAAKNSCNNRITLDIGGAAKNSCKYCITLDSGGAVNTSGDKRIASETKDLWIKINDAYNEDSHHPRTAAELTKKWDNLVQTHRAKYSQYKRELGRTGSGTNPVKLSEVTERVMAVVGENSPNIVGLGSGLDSTILQMQSSNCSAVETPSQPSHTIELYEEPLQPNN